MMAVKALFPELVQLTDHVFCTEICHAAALVDPSLDTDLPYSAQALRRLAIPRPAITLHKSETATVTGMRVRFQPASRVYLETFYDARASSGRRLIGGSIRTGKTGPDTPAYRDPSRSSLTEHAVSCLIRHDHLKTPIPHRADELDEWVDAVHRATHYVSDMPRRPDRIYLDDTTLPVTRIDDPRRNWAAAAVDLGNIRITIAGSPSFLDRRFQTVQKSER